MNFRKHLDETYVNLFTSSQKDRFKGEIYDKIQIAYSPIGGLKGSGFRSADDMLNIKMWKISVDNGIVTAGIMYKDKNFRKAVAVFTDGSKKGKAKLKEMLEADFKRSSLELSLSLLKFCERNMASLLNKYSIPAAQAQVILGKEIEIIDKFYYKRKIGSEMLTKRMVGVIKPFR
jgi:hypothetical protein